MVDLLLRLAEMTDPDTTASRLMEKVDAFAGVSHRTTCACSLGQ